jgi:hypothetical protein
MAAGFLLIYLIQTRIDESFGSYRATEEVLLIEDGKFLRKATVGFESLAADLYWLRTVQYFGGKRQDVHNKNFDLLEPLLNVTTDLDPNLKIVYDYGATFLSEPFPRGASQPYKGIELLDRGIRNHPKDWRLYLSKGFLYFWYLEDYKKAAEIFLEGSKIEGAPSWLISTAGRTLARGGDRATARELWHILYQTSETQQQRDNATIHLKQLDALDEMDSLKAVLVRYQETTGRPPESWADVVRAGLLPRIPADPAGHAYLLDPKNLRADVSKTSPLVGLPTR